MRRHFDAAPWSTALKVTSLLGTVVVAAVAVFAYRVVPTPTGFTHAFGVGVALVPLVLLAGSVLFVVSGFAVEGEALLVERLVTSTRIPLEGLTRIAFDPRACKGSLRVIGNGGLFSFTGLFYSRSLGRYRLFATDFSRSVVLTLPRRVVVVTPASPHAFVAHLHSLFPGAEASLPPAAYPPAIG